MVKPMTNTAFILGNITNKIDPLSKAPLTWISLEFKVTSYGIWFWFCLTLIYIPHACCFWLLTASLIAGNTERTQSSSQKLSLYFLHSKNAGMFQPRIGLNMHKPNRWIHFLCFYWGIQIMFDLNNQKFCMIRYI